MFERIKRTTCCSLSWLVLLSLFFLAEVFLPGSVCAISNQVEFRGAFPSGEVLVKFKEGVGASGIVRVRKAINAIAVEPSRLKGLERIRFEEIGVEEALQRLRSSKLVEYAEPNYLRHVDFTPNDPYFDDQWNMNDNSEGADINMVDAWEIEKGKEEVVVAVLDTGIAYEDRGVYRKAPDLSGSFVSGYDFVNDDEYADDDNGHGTHVAGTIAQSTNNSYGAAGVAFGCSLMPVKVLDRKGDGSDSALIDGITFAADEGADVINMSLSGTDSSRALQDAVDYAFSKGIVICASSGNEGEGSVSYPAACDNVIAVGATDRYCKRASYSNYGRELDLVAPGGDGENFEDGILQESYRMTGSPQSGFEIVSMVGTSCACPHVAGVAALLESHHPDWSVSEISAAITSNAKDLGQAGWDYDYGWGLLDANAALKGSRSLAKSPSISRVSPNHARVGERVTVEIRGEGFSSTPKVTLERYGENAILGTLLGGDATSATCEFDLSGALAGMWDVVIRDSSGASARSEGAFMVDSSISNEWYLAEGSTNYGFEEFILIQNPGDTEVVANTTFYTNEGARPPLACKVAPRSRSTLRVNDVIAGEDVSAKVESSGEIICERSMYLLGRLEGTDSIGVEAPSKSWYFSEGATAYGYETFLLLMNPTDKNATAWVTYMTPEGPVERKAVKLAANTRYTVNVSDDLPASEMSIMVLSDQRIIAERSMYWDERRGAHDSIGVNCPAGEWFLAEGSTNWGFSEYVLIANPGDEEIWVNITYMTPEGPVTRSPLPVSPKSRKTLDLNQEMPLCDLSVMASSSAGIIVERAMYWNNSTGRAGHCSIGVAQPRTQSLLAEGTTNWGFETWLLVQNPGESLANVSVEYNTSNGAVQRPDFSVFPGSRTTVYLNGELPPVDTSIKVRSDTPIIAERAMYWNARGGGHNSQGLLR